MVPNIKISWSWRKCYEFVCASVCVCVCVFTFIYSRRFQWECTLFFRNTLITITQLHLEMCNCVQPESDLQPLSSSTEAFGVISGDNDRWDKPRPSLSRSITQINPTSPGIWTGDPPITPHHSPNTMWWCQHQIMTTCVNFSADWLGKGFKSLK